MEARLALAEFLLSSTDLQASSRRAVDWLVAHSTVERAVVAIADGLSGHILIVAEHGVSSTVIADFALTRDDGAHPLVRALGQPEPTYFERSGRRFHSPIDGPFHAVPLRSDDDV